MTNNQTLLATALENGYKEEIVTVLEDLAFHYSGYSTGQSEALYQEALEWYTGRTITAWLLVLASNIKAVELRDGIFDPRDRDLADVIGCLKVASWSYV